jgi:IclR family transcriptional regulator, mhp operon transcriptional activator
MSQTTERSLMLLEALNRKESAHVRELAAEVGLPRSTVTRLLKALKRMGYVDQLNDGEAYRVAERVLALSSGYRSDMAVIDFADAVMRRLTKQVKWPMALGRRSGDAMLVIHSTIPQSPLAWYRTTINMRLPFFWSAMGWAYVAHLPRHEQLLLIKASHAELPALSQRALAAQIHQVKEQGYGYRMPGAGHTTASLSVPILIEDHVVACLSLTFSPKAVSLEQAIERYVHLIKDAANEIVQDMYSAGHR